MNRDKNVLEIVKDYLRGIGAKGLRTQSGNCRCPTASPFFLCNRGDCVRFVGDCVPDFGRKDGEK